MARLNRKNIEDAIEERFGMKVRLHRDQSGYYHFYSDDKETDLELNRWPSTSVYTFRLNHMSLEHWLHSFGNLKEMGEK